MVSGTIVIYIKEELLEITKQKNKYLNILWGTPLLHQRGTPGDITGVTLVRETSLSTQEVFIQL